MRAAAPPQASDLARRLVEAEATIKALLAGEIDAVVDARSNSPVLLSRAQLALQESEQRYRLLFENSPLSKWLYDVQSLRFLTVNEAAIRHYGYSREEFMTMSILDLRDPAETEAVVSALASARSDQTSFGVWKHRKKDGSIIEVEITGHTFQLQGRMTRLVVAQDITERLHGEETLRWLAAIVGSSWDAIISTGPEGFITSWNPGAERLFGYAAAEALGKPVSVIGPGEGVRKLVARVIAGEVIRELETTAVRKDGARVQVSLSLSVIRDSSGKVLGTSGMIRDVGDRRAAEEQVRLLHNIVLAAGEATTLDETLAVVLRLLCQATGFLVANAWIPDGHAALEPRGQWARPEDLGRYAPLVEGRTFAAGESLPGRAWATRQPVWVDHLSSEPGFLRAAEAAAMGLCAGVAVPILAGEDLMAVIEGFLPVAAEKERVLATLAAVGAQLGSVLQRRRAEEALRKSEEQLRQAQKLEAIGQLTGGVAHDFNNLLSIILSYSGLLAEDLKPDDPRRADLLEIRNAGERAAALTQQLLAFSRRQVLQPRIVDLNEVVCGLENMLRRLIGEDIELTVLPALEPARVSVDPGQMEQVIMNLAVNARDAMPTGGQLTIELSFAELDEVFALEHAGVTAGRHVMLAVSDTGQGIDKATQARVFEPFFTTKELGKGTGLGLSTVLGIVRQSAGTIWLYSELGIGTSFKIFFPVAQAGGVSAPLRRPQPALLHGSETILLVEDEEGVRKLARIILQRHGYRVVEAKDGAEAIRLATELPHLDLLLTDVVMPRMSGAETAARLVEICPGLRVIYMSGYTDNAVVLHGVLRSEAAFVQKPITPAALLSKVRAVLDAPLAGPESKSP